MINSTNRQIQSLKFAERLRFFRQRNGLTQNQFPGFDCSRISRYESGQCFPSRKKIIELARILNVHPAELMPIQRTEEMHDPDVVRSRLYHHAQELYAAGEYYAAYHAAQKFSCHAKTPTMWML